MAISVLQEAHNEIPSGGGTATTIAVTLTVAAGSALHVYVMENASASGGSISLSDNRGQAYTGNFQVSDASRLAWDFYLIGAAAGSTTITATFTLGAFVAGIWVKEIGQASAFQVGIGQLQIAPGAGTDAVTSTTVTPTSQPALLSGFTFGDNNADTTVVGTGFSAGSGITTWPLFGATNVGVSESLRLTSTAAKAATWTATAGGGANRWKSVVAVFTEGAAAASQVPFTSKQPAFVPVDEPPAQRRARLVFDTPAVTRVPFSRAAQQQALSQWMEAPSGLILQRQLVRPTLPVMTGLKLWLRGDLGITQGGGNVTAWADQSGNGNDVVNVGTVPFAASSINGNPGITCSATAGMQNVTSSPIAAGGPRTIFIVAKGSSEYGGALFCNRISSHTQEVWLMGAAGSVPGLIYGSDVGSVASYYKIPVPAVGSPLILEEAVTGAAGAAPTVHLNGASQATTPVGSSTSVETGALGFGVGILPYLTSAFGWHGDICEVIVFDSVLSASDEALIHQYLSSRYNIALAGTPLPLSRAAQLQAIRSAWDLDAPPRFERRLLVPSGAPLPDSPVPGWNRRISDAISRAAWDGGGGLPELLAKSAANSPTLPVMAGLKLWLRADLGVTKDVGGAVSQWDDQSGNGNHGVQLTPGSTPFWNASDGLLNGKPTLVFNGGWFLTGATNIVAAGNARTILLVHRRASGSNWLFEFRSAAPAFRVAWNVNGTLATEIYSDGASNQAAIPSVGNYDKPTINEIAWDGNTAHDITARLSGYVAPPVVHTSGSGTTSDTGTTGYQIGGAASLIAAEVIVFDRVLSAAEGLAIRQYLAARYGIDLVDQPVPFTRTGQAIALRGWEPPPPMPPVLWRSSIDKIPPPPNGKVTPPLLAFVGLVEFTLAEIGGPTQVVVATIDLTTAEVGGPSQMVVVGDSDLTLKGDT